MGAAWGGFMWLFTSVLLLLKSGADVSSVSSVIIGLPFWALGGFEFGFLMWLILGRSPKQANQGETLSGETGGKLP